MFLSLNFSATADDRRQISFVWNRAPLSHVRPFTSPCDSSSDFKLSHAKEISELSTKVGTITGQVHFDKSHLSNAIPTLSHGKDELLPMKGLVFLTLFLPKAEMCSSMKKLLFALSCGSPHLFTKICKKISGLVGPYLKHLGQLIHKMNYLGVPSSLPSLAEIVLNFHCRSL